MAEFICYPRKIPYGETYNCHECTDRGCEHWGDYNFSEEEEEEHLRILNPDIAEFFWATCERYKEIKFGKKI